MKNKGKRIIWPANIDGTKSKGQGRIISKKDSVQSPELDEIKRSAEMLGLNPEMEPDKAYPRSWWEFRGRVLVDDKGSKSSIARKIADNIKKWRVN
ncbi:MAG: signal recognition particle protein Srp19 [Methanocellales archaeon]|nr:signal recognition particle protein Srp19 [Methanocellales archaeon]MDD3291572.1 signal recognition particle protein Srp19 [Methanocellales archaeon]MDD5235862.1 signal recognition particle protein Srp19 [Methanocellales archaeon]MDD5485355.1 signal recognition particle protein Srp19 [Methanocellales archaeon]